VENITHVFTLISRCSFIVHLWG